jgi:hypothetical protein
MRTKDELEKIAEQSLMQMPQDMKPSELGYVLSCMMKGHSIALKNNGY